MKPLSMNRFLRHMGQRMLREHVYLLSMTFVFALVMLFCVFTASSEKDYANTSTKRLVYYTAYFICSLHTDDENRLSSVSTQQEHGTIAHHIDDANEATHYFPLNIIKKGDAK